MVERAGVHLREAFRIAEPGRDRALIAQDLAGCLRLAWRHHEADGFSLAEDMIAEAFAAARQRGSVVFTTRAYVARSMLRVRQGALSEAEADADAALDTAGDADFYFALLSLAVLLDALAARGALVAADQALERMGMGGEIPDTFVHNWVLDSRGRVRLAQGRLDHALADLEELARRTQRRGQLNPGVHPHRSARAQVLPRRGDTGRAIALAEEELALARRWHAPRAVGMSLRALGVCVGGESGLDRLRQSVDVLERSGARLEHAGALIDLGAALRRSGRRADAREPLRTGMELAHRCGAPPLVERAREELWTTGARPRRIMRTGIDALTPSELRVARMAAEGMTNRAIAQALFVTARTVEGHLTHIFQKLDVTSRGGLADRLAAGD